MSLLSMLNAFNASAKAFSEKTRHSNVVYQATSKLKQDAYAERCVLETALKLAKSDVEHQKHMESPVFREAYERIKSAMAEKSPGLRAERIDSPVPTFDQVPSHQDPDVHSAILEVVASVREERVRFLEGIRQQLVSDTAARPHFARRLKELGADRYLPDLALPPL